MKKTRRMTVRLTQAHWKKLEQMADATNATPSDAMRFLVENADTILDPQTKNAGSNRRSGQSEY